jgi:pimeloyl-ACP methyl ester carboxylesterase
MKKLRQFVYYSFLLLATWIFLSQCIIMKNRLSDKKTQAIFKNKGLDLMAFDTIVDGNKLHYTISGDSLLPTLVFIHGSPGSWMNYMKFMQDSSLRKKFRFVGIDRPGFGYSNFGKAQHLQQQSKAILAALKAVKNNRDMYLFGHSMGAPVVVDLAAREPNMFKGIVLAAGSIDVNQEKKENWRRIMEVRPFYWMLPGAFAPSNTELLYLKKDLIPLQSQFEKITCEVYFIHGSKDTWVPIENIAYGKKMMVNAKKIIADTIVGADHQIPWKNKDRVIAHLNNLY